MINPTDMEACREAIRHGSLSFYAASKLLPASVRDPAMALYAFCRLADDAVDLQDAKADAVLRLRDRLDLVYAGRPRDAAADRAFADVVATYEMPRALPDALLEGLAWDADWRRYASLSDLNAYCARVASAVGVMMAVLMRVRDRNALARACDLGVAMQLTNIARDIAEDAHEGRLYLPQEWFAAAGLDPEAFLAAPASSPQIRAMAKRLVMEANRLYFRSEPGIAALPLSSRPGIYAARFIYAGIGGQLGAMQYDSFSGRAHTTKLQKIGWLGQSLMRTGVSLLMPQSAVVYAPPVPEVAFLVDAAASSPQRQSGRSDALLSALAALEARRRAERDTLIGRSAKLG